MQPFDQSGVEEDYLQVYSDGLINTSLPSQDILRILPINVARAPKVSDKLLMEKAWLFAAMRSATVLLSAAIPIGADPALFVIVRSPPVCENTELSTSEIPALPASGGAIALPLSIISASV
jgi:hypothetical protein